MKGLIKLYLQILDILKSILDNSKKNFIENLGEIELIIQLQCN